MKTAIHMRRVMRDSILMYFAPITGAVKGIQAELKRTDRDIARRRAQEKKQTAKHA